MATDEEYIIKDIADAIVSSIGSYYFEFGDKGNVLLTDIAIIEKHIREGLEKLNEKNDSSAVHTDSNDGELPD